MSPLCTRAEVIIGGEPYTLACTMRALWSFEDRTGRQLHQALPDIESTLTMLWAMLITEHPDITEIDVGAVTPQELPAALAAVNTLLTRTAPRPPEFQHKQASGQRLTWRELWAIARHDMQLTEQEFWRLEPWQFDELMRRRDARSEESYYGHSMVCSTVANCHIDSEKTAPYKPLWFLPTPRGEEEREARKREEEIEQAKGLKSKLEALVKAWGPRVKVIKK